MILITKPSRTTVTHEIQVSGQPVRIPGMTTYDTVEIVCPDKDNSKQEVWATLKYGCQPDLCLGDKIDIIPFPESGVILHGVVPIEVKRTELWEGRVFECKIDYYEAI